MSHVLKKLTSFILPYLPYGLKTKWYAFLNNKTQVNTPYNTQISQRLQQIAMVENVTQVEAVSVSDEQIQVLENDVEPKYQGCNLIMVTIDNNNKFYNMVEKGDGTFVVTYGRVGNMGLTETYPMEKWNIKYKAL